jgi:kynureninase
MAALRAAMEIFDEAGMEALRRKSVALTGYLEALLDEQSSEKFEIITPREPERRGAMLAIRIRKNGRGVVEKLLEQGVFTDFREPDILRVTPAPLYNSYRDVAGFVEKFVSAVG